MNHYLNSTAPYHDGLKFDPVARIDLTNLQVTIVPSSCSDPAPGLKGYARPAFIFPGSSNDIISIHGRETPTGNLSLIFSFPGNTHTVITASPPFVIFWASGDANDLASGHSLGEN